MAMIFSLCNCNVMFYITEMHVMPITFQLLSHYNKFLHVVYFKTLLQDYQTKITTKLYISRVKHIVLQVSSILQIFAVKYFSLQSRIRCFMFGHSVCNNWQLLSV